ncbi:MAG TPA: orotate phosphoribosyltransferase [Rhizomicrobium sp.]|jgi:orotate phosphoribosyltransferase|nr:orotate phosphoribosyltransferase [Rhizomicrobium sp.]
MTVNAETRTAEDQELFDLVRRRSFRRGHFVLSSGRESEMYFNLKPAMLDPRGAFLCASTFLKIIAGENIGFAGGLEMGAVPMLGSLAALSEMQRRPLRTFFVRKKPKTHGTQELIEGLAGDETLSGARVIIVDDVATTGNSALIAAQVAREAGALVDCALVLVDREEGAREMLANEGIRLLSILRGPDFLK